jgi:hypothetical protein
MLALKCWGPDPRSLDCLNFHEFLLNPLLLLLRRFGYFEIHAACCVLDKQSYLFVGPSGSGKTSAVLSLIGSGAKYLSDDLFLVFREAALRFVG